MKNLYVRFELTGVIKPLLKNARPVVKSVTIINFERYIQTHHTIVYGALAPLRK